MSTRRVRGRGGPHLPKAECPGNFGRITAARIEDTKGTPQPRFASAPARLRVLDVELEELAALLDRARRAGTT
jgi:topoisomerase IA-like protein